MAGGQSGAAFAGSAGSRVVGRTWTGRARVDAPKAATIVESPTQVPGGAEPAATSTGTVLRNPAEVRFSQDSIKAGFKDPKFGSIDDLAEGVRTGRIKPADIEPIRLIEREGKLITIDNRRLEAFRRAGVEIPTRMATPEEIAQATRQGKFSAGELGSETIRVRGR
jgi:hypothetical protein